MVQRPRGTRDFTPQVMARRLAFEQLLEERSRRHGFKRVQTPAFESLDLFTANLDRASSVNCTPLKTKEVARSPSDQNLLRQSCE